VNVVMRSAVALLAVVLVAVTASPANAMSQKVAVDNMRGSLLNAWFSDLSGCIETDTFVTANGSTDQLLPGRGTQTLMAAVNIYRYDSCTGATLLQAIGQIDTLTADELEVSKQLDSGSLHTTIALTNIDTGDSFDVAVDVDWVGTSAITRDDVNSNDKAGGCHVLNRWKGSGREADASGSVSDGVTNFTPNGSASAEIGFVIDGFEVINCA
jgi:hypothetical protein